jgi:hypothetical protein
MLWLDEEGQIGGDVRAIWNLPDGQLGSGSFSLCGPERLCEWDDFHIERSHQEEGLATTFCRALVALCSQLGFASIMLRAEGEGRYCWARLGFDFEDPDERQQILEAAAEFADRLGLQVDLSEVEHAVTLASLPGTVSYGAFAAAQGARRPLEPEKQMKLGRALLLGPTNTMWSGRFEVPPRVSVVARVDLAQRPILRVEDEAADVVAVRELAGGAEAVEGVVKGRLEVAEGAEAPVGQDAVVGELPAEVILGGVAQAAALMHDHHDVLGAQQSLGCAERAHGVVGDEAARVADDVGVAALEAEHREEVDARVHAGQHGDLALRAGAEPRGRQLG